LCEKKMKEKYKMAGMGANPHNQGKRIAIIFPKKEKPTRQPMGGRAGIRLSGKFLSEAAKERKRPQKDHCEALCGEKGAGGLSFG